MSLWASKEILNVHPRISKSGFFYEYNDSDIENIQNVVFNVLRHRLGKNYKADAEGVTLDNIISNLL